MQAGIRGSIHPGRQTCPRVLCSANGAACPKLIHKGKLFAIIATSWQRQEERLQKGSEELKKQLKGGVNWMGAILPFATAAQSSAGATAEIYGAIAKALDIYLLVLTVRVILTWFRNINWYNEPFATLRQFTDPFLNTFRGILPSFGGIDVSPMIGFLLLNFVRNQLVHLSRTMIL